MTENPILSVLDPCRVSEFDKPLPGIVENRLIFWELMENQSAYPQHSMADQGIRPVRLANTLPSNSADDGYIWTNLGLQENFLDSDRLVCYKCSDANCMVKKLVRLSADGQILDIVYKGCHNHHRRDAPTGYIPAADSQCYVPSEMYVAGTSIPDTEEGGEQEQLGSSSDSEEEDDGEQRADGHVAGASVTERF